MINNFFILSFVSRDTKNSINKNKSEVFSFDIPIFQAYLLCTAFVPQNLIGIKITWLFPIPFALPFVHTPCRLVPKVLFYFVLRP